MLSGLAYYDEATLLFDDDATAPAPTHDARRHYAFRREMQDARVILHRKKAAVLTTSPAFRRALAHFAHSTARVKHGDMP